MRHQRGNQLHLSGRARHSQVRAAPFSLKDDYSSTSSFIKELHCGGLRRRSHSRTPAENRRDERQWGIERGERRRLLREGLLRREADEEDPLGRQGDGLEAQLPRGRAFVPEQRGGKNAIPLEKIPPSFLPFPSSGECGKGAKKVGGKKKRRGSGGMSNPICQPFSSFSPKPRQGKARQGKASQPPKGHFPKGKIIERRRRRGSSSSFCAGCFVFEMTFPFLLHDDEMSLFCSPCR